MLNHWLRWLVALLVATVAVPAIAGAAPIPAGMPDPPPGHITSVTPSYGPTDTQVTIRANVSLEKATDVVWGGHRSKGFSVQKDGSILTTVPIGGFPGATTVPVTVILDNVMLPTDSTFTIPIGEVDIVGPSPFVPGDPSDYFWFNGGGRDFTLGPSGTVLFGSQKPVFYLTTAYIRSSYPYSPAKAPLAAGNQGRFQAQLWMCDVGSDVPDMKKKGFTSSCKNWDGYEGVWVTVDSKCNWFLGGEWTASLLPWFNPEILHYEASGLGVDRDKITFDLSPCFDEENLARTFQYGVLIAQEQVGPSLSFPSRTDSKGSPAFNVVIPPAAMLETNVIPYTILYQPPGDESTVSFTAAKTYSTQFNIAGSKNVVNKSTTSQTSSTNFAMDMAFLIGFTGASGTTETDTTEKDFGTQQGGGPQGTSSTAFSFQYSLPAQPGLVPGAGLICTSTTTVACSATTPTPNLYALEPFWYDTFVLIIHPQFVVWVIGGNADRYQMYGAAPALGEIEVALLDACATGNTLSYGTFDPCAISYSDSNLGLEKSNLVYKGSTGTVKLSPAEARDLLALDPFYAGGQNADLDASRVNQVASPPYGSTAAESGSGYTAQLSNTDQLQLNKTAQVTYTTDITQMEGDSTSTGLTFKLSGGGGSGGSGGGSSGGTAGGGESLTVGSQDKFTTETDIQLTYQNSTAVSNQKVTTANVSLNDTANCPATPPTPPATPTPCHGPLAVRPSVNIFLDRAFGGFMFQDPGAPKGYSRDQAPKCCVMLVNALIQQEMIHPRFSDVPKTDPEMGVIGLLALTGVLPGNADGTFKPNDPLTREQLAVALAQAAHLPASASSAKFEDVTADNPNASMIAAATAASVVAPRSAQQFGPGDAVTPTDLAGALSRAGLAKGAGMTEQQAAGSMTRAEAARVIFAALQNR
jgi:uncharacterized membrane protein YgcG